MTNNSLTLGEDLIFHYGFYLGACALLIGWLGRELHRAGRTFLTDAFAGNTALVKAVGRLLDIGFYLVSVGYVALTYESGDVGMTVGWVIRILIMKTGGLLLVLGIGHMFNLLLLAIFRRRGAGISAQQEARHA